MDNNDELNMNIDFELFDAMQAGKESDFSVSSDDTAEIPCGNLNQNDRSALKNQFFSSGSNRMPDENENFQMSASDADFFKSALAQAELDRRESPCSSARQPESSLNGSGRGQINRGEMDRAALLQFAREQSSRSRNNGKATAPDRQALSAEPSKSRSTDSERSGSAESASSRSGLFGSSLFRSSAMQTDSSAAHSLTSESSSARSASREIGDRTAMDHSAMDRAALLASAQERSPLRKSGISNSPDERDQYSDSFSVSGQGNEISVRSEKSLYNSKASSTFSSDTTHQRKKRNRFVTFCRTIFFLTFLTLGSWALYGVGLSDQECFWSNVFEKQLAYVKIALGNGPQFFPFTMGDFEANKSKNFPRDNSIKYDSNDSNTVESN